MKSCNKCGEDKEYSCFSKGKGYKDGYKNICKGCINAARRGRRSETAEQYRKYNIKYKYGITPQEYDALYTIQEGKCFICETPESYCPTGKLHIDHDHDTGNIRGLLCTSCNTGIGKLKDNIELLDKAKEYLLISGKR